MMSPFTSKALAIAALEVGVMEEPLGSNRGPRVDEYIRSAGLKPGGGFSWCMCFVYWCFNEAAKAMELQNPLVKTGGVLKHWNDTAARRIAVSDARLFVEDIPGTIFIISSGGGLGHTGLVEAVEESPNGKMLRTIEGNTNDGGSREGIGVFRRRRALTSVKGFIDYSNAGAEPPKVIS